MRALDPLAPFVVPDWVTELPLSDVGGRAERRIREMATAEMLGAQGVFERAGKAAAAGEAGTPSSEDIKPMSRMVVLLDLADRVATDGYRDARLDIGFAGGIPA